MTLDEIEKFLEESLDEQQYPDMDENWYRMRLREVLIRIRKYKDEHGQKG